MLFCFQIQLQQLPAELVILWESDIKIGTQKCRYNFNNVPVIVSIALGKKRLTWKHGVLGQKNKGRDYQELFFPRVVLILAMFMHMLMRAFIHKPLIFLWIYDASAPSVCEGLQNTSVCWRRILNLTLVLIYPWQMSV